MSGSKTTDIGLFLFSHAGQRLRCAGVQMIPRHTACVTECLVGYLERGVIAYQTASGTIWMPVSWAGAGSVLGFGGAWLFMLLISLLGRSGTCPTGSGQTKAKLASR